MQWRQRGQLPGDGSNERGSPPRGPLHARRRLDSDGVTTATFIPNANGGKCADAVPGNDDPYEYEHRVPRPLQLGSEVPMDTRGLADRNHVVQVRIEDAAGNKTTAFGPRTIAVNNAPAPTTPPPSGGTPGTPPPGTET